MPDPRLATLLPSDRGRMYTHPVTREQHVSSTTVLRTLAKELTRWAARLTAAEAWEQRQWMLGVTKQQAVDALSGAPFRDRDERGDHGSLVHIGCELLAMSAAGWPLTPEQQTKLATMLGGLQGTSVQLALFRFAEWANTYVSQWLHLEQTVWGNGWAGTFDAIVVLKDGRIALVDYKTGKGIYRETVLQLASYWSAPIILNAEGAETAMPPVDVCAVVHLPEVGGYNFRDLEVGPEDAEDFERILDHWHWCERTPLNPGVAIPVATAPGVPGQRACGDARKGGTIVCIKPQGHDGDHHGKSKTGSRNYYWSDDVPGSEVSGAQASKGTPTPVPDVPGAAEPPLGAPSDPIPQGSGPRPVPDVPGPDDSGGLTPVPAPPGPAPAVTHTAPAGDGSGQQEEGGLRNLAGEVVVPQSELDEAQDYSQRIAALFTGPGQ